jgi:hypothetical protein
MKKSYISPELMVVNIKTECILEGSNPGVNSNPVDPGVALVKGRDDFDFDGGSGSDWGDELW